MRRFAVFLALVAQQAELTKKMESRKKKKKQVKNASLLSFGDDDE